MLDNSDHDSVHEVFGTFGFAPDFSILTPQSGILFPMVASGQSDG
jgi:hypothetical protein